MYVLWNSEHCFIVFVKSNLAFGGGGSSLRSIVQIFFSRNFLWFYLTADSKTHLEIGWGRGFCIYLEERCRLIKWFRQRLHFSFLLLRFSKIIITVL